MKHIRKFNESWFGNLFKREEQEPVTPESIRARQWFSRGQSDNKLQNEADAKFPSLVKELDNKLRKTNDNAIEVKQNPTFKTKSSTPPKGDGVNYILMKMIEDHYTERGFRTSKSYDGRDYCKHDWFRIIVD